MNSPEEIAPPCPKELPPAEAAEEQAPPPPGGMKRAAISAGMWTVIGYGSSLLIRMASTIILTRLVENKVIGLIALVYTFLTGLHMFTDVGLGTSIIQSKRGDEPHFYNTAWTLQIFRGGLLFLGTVLIAWPVSQWALPHPEPELLLLLPAVGIIEFVSNLNSTALYALSRHLLRGRLVLIEVGTTLLGTCVTIAYAYHWPTAWAMVAGPMAGAAVQMLVSHVIIPGYRNHFRWDRTALGELIHFGKWIFFGTIFTFLGSQSDRLIVGKLTGEATLGIYYIAVQLTGIASTLMSTLAGQLIFPFYSRLLQAGRDIPREFSRVHVPVAGFAALLACGLWVTGPAAIHVMYRPQYFDAAWIIQFLAVGAWFSMLESTLGASMLALGEPRAVMISNATKLGGLIVFVPLGYWLGGLQGGEEDALRGLLCGFVVSDVVRYLVMVGIVRTRGLSGWMYDLALSALIVLIALFGSWTGAGVAAAVLGGEPGPEARWEQLLLFTCQGVLVTAVWGAIGLAWWYRGKRLRRLAEGA
jgi:O-antigen/teichoic acid export membrane protein